MKSRTFSFRVSGSWFSELERLLFRLSMNPNRDRARVVRDLVTTESHMWLYSPYIAISTKCFVFVTAEGVLAQWIVQNLILNESRERLPAAYTIKPEEKPWIEETFDGSALDDFWLLNYFAAWRGVSIKDELICQDVDRKGITWKSVDLPISMPKDTAVVREVLVVFNDRFGIADPIRGTTMDDRADLAIDLPTQELEFSIIVDLSLYKDPITKRFAAIAYELRNRELARFKETKLDSGLRPIDWIVGNCGSGGRPSRNSMQALDAAVGNVNDLQLRLADVTESDQRALCDGMPIVKKRRNRSILRSMSLPRQFLFGRLLWRNPIQNITVSMSWNKPR